MSADDGLTIVDCHGHVHPCFSPEAALDAASENLERVARGRGFTGVLMLAEPDARDPFAGIRAGEWTRWSLEATGDPREGRARAGTRTLTLVAGFQVPTAEGLEVLCLGCRERPADREPLGDVVRQARAAGALAVVPWGAGKWLGRRGVVVSEFLETVDDSGVFLGDNGGRPAAWRPRHFERARERGVRVLPGSDPLPFASQSERLGGHGVTFPGQLPGTGAVAALIRRLEDPAVPLEHFGSREHPLRFVRNQVAMQWQLRARGHGN